MKENTTPDFSLPEYLENERKVFNEKIRIKLENGFVPDIRNMKKNPYFIKQFWRDPYLTNLVLGKVINKYYATLNTYVGGRNHFGCWLWSGLYKS